MTVGNTWLAIVLIVGVAWLLSRRARRGWLSLLAVAVLIPLQALLAMNFIDTGTTLIVMYATSALVGAGIIVAGRPLRD